MSERVLNIETEIASIERKADQSCSIHAALRDANAFKASLLDHLLIAAATYLLALTFADPALGLYLTFGFPTHRINAVVTLIVFFLTIVQFKNDWKTRAHDHHVAFTEYAAVKKQCRMITSGTQVATAPELQRIRAVYDAATEKGTDIPDAKFLWGKARHVRKVYVSKHLDSHPGACVPLVKFKLMLRDTFGIDLLKSP